MVILKTQIKVGHFEEPGLLPTLPISAEPQTLSVGQLCGSSHFLYDKLHREQGKTA